MSKNITKNKAKFQMGKISMNKVIITPCVIHAADIGKTSHTGSLVNFIVKGE